jgi:hypothetical protein
MEEGTHGGSNRRVRFTASAMGDAVGGEDSDDEVAGGGGGGSGWGTTRSGGPVVVIPGTNAAVDALLLISRDDLPVVRRAAVAAVSQIFFPLVRTRHRFGTLVTSSLPPLSPNTSTNLARVCSRRTSGFGRSSTSTSRGCATSTGAPWRRRRPRSTRRLWRWTPTGASSSRHYARARAPRTARPVAQPTS